MDYFEFFAEINFPKETLESIKPNSDYPRNRRRLLKPTAKSKQKGGKKNAKR
jgi:hypothetical protein